MSIHDHIAALKPPLRRLAPELIAAPSRQTYVCPGTHVPVTHPTPQASAEQEHRVPTTREERSIASTNTSSSRRLDGEALAQCTSPQTSSATSMPRDDQGIWRPGLGLTALCIGIRALIA
ncbi:hypothetical protein KC358_g79 [Hortaea werneckii]|nr:hypothetical protein KC358_g79 [Hortaea werneckii]